MPPPPPPSKSYLLVFDSDSSDDDDSYRIRVRDTPVVVGGRGSIVHADQEDPASKDQKFHATTTNLIPATADPQNRRRPHVIEDDDDDDDRDEDDDEEDVVNTSSEVELEDGHSNTTSPRGTNETENSGTQLKLTKNQKKKRTRRRNKKQAKASSSTTKGQKGHRIKFSNVSCRIYPRSFSDVSVPLDGGWPLGMELEPLLEGTPEDITIEEFEAKKQERLKERWEKLLQVTTIDDSTLEQMTKSPNDGIPLSLETRQWDYRNKVKNPLFGALSEKQRQDLLLDASSTGCGEDSLLPPQKGRPRSQSVTDAGTTTKHDSSSPKRRGRTSSFSHTEHFNEKYDQVYVHQVRNGLEQLRNERSKSGSSGCNCRKLSVYIPPKNGSGKKAAHRRLKPSKLRDELKKRNLLDESKSREELEQILHDAVEKEPCCGTTDCFCYRNGIDCQADACSCWHDSHVNTKSTDRYLSVETITARCGNPLGTMVVDIDGIDDYRKRVLEAIYCQFITTVQ